MTEENIAVRNQKFIIRFLSLTNVLYIWFRLDYTSLCIDYPARRNLGLTITQESVDFVILNNKKYQRYQNVLLYTNRVDDLYLFQTLLISL